MLPVFLWNEEVSVVLHPSVILRTFFQLRQASEVGTRSAK